MNKTYPIPGDGLSTYILFEGARELLGARDLNRIMQKIPAAGRARSAAGLDGDSFYSPSEAGQFTHSLEQIYGVQGGRGLAMRIGRAAFKYGLQSVGKKNGLYDLEYRLLPAPRRLEKGLEILARLLGDEFGSQVSVEDEQTCWMVRIEDCPLCAGSQTTGPCCQILSGLFQGLMAWAGNGRFYPVVETECRAAGGAACVFKIDKIPLD